jgi:drug/metabolite transporter (DMT)-like permease
MKTLRGYIFIMIAVLFWGVSATAAKYLFTHNVDTLIIVQTRSSLAFLLLFGYFVIYDSSVLKIHLRDLGFLIVLGVIGIATTNFLYYFTVRETTVATAILIQYTAPVMVTLYATFFHEERFTKIKFFALALSMIGCFLAVSGGDVSTIRIQGLGLVTGIGSAVTYSFMIILSKHILQRYKQWTMLIYAFGFAMLFWLCINTPLDIMAKDYSLHDWGIFLLFSICSILIPYSFFAAGLRLVQASRASIVSTLEPVTAIVSAYLFIGEKLNSVQALGAIVVLAAVGLLEIKREEQEPA